MSWIEQVVFVRLEEGRFRRLPQRRYTGFVNDGATLPKYARPDSHGYLLTVVIHLDDKRKVVEAGPMRFRLLPDGTCDDRYMMERLSAFLAKPEPTIPVQGLVNAEKRFLARRISTYTWEPTSRDLEGLRGSLEEYLDETAQPT